MFGSVWGCCREGNASSGHTFKLLMHPTFTSLYQNQSRAMELRQDHRAVKRFTNAVGAAIPKHKAKHSPTHIASHKNDISCFSPLSHCLAKQTILGSNGTVAFPWGSLGVFVGQKLTEQTKCPWVLLLLLCPGSSLHVPSGCSWFSGLSQTKGINLANH